MGHALRLAQPRSQHAGGCLEVRNRGAARRHGEQDSVGDPGNRQDDHDLEDGETALLH
jgi:hypothetical protein